jgi:phosphonate transport system substrate-binding protein
LSAQPRGGPHRPDVIQRSPACNGNDADRRYGGAPHTEHDRMTRPLLAALLSSAAGLALAASSAHAASDCPATPIRFGVVPYDSSAGFTPLYKQIAHLVSEKLGCPVELQIGTSYNATIEAMRAGKLDMAEFGPLSYVLAHEVAKAEVVATYSNAEGKPDTYTASIVTWPGSGITDIKGVAGHSFAYSDPASTSGHLFPAYGLAQNGIDPDKGVRAIYAGSHTASFEALRNHKVESGELNSSEIASATVAGIYKPGDYVTLWTSQPIPQDPITVRGGLDPALKARITAALQGLDFSSIPADQRKIINVGGTTLVPQTDGAYDQIRDLVHVLHIDLAKLNS